LNQQQSSAALYADRYGCASLVFGTIGSMWGVALGSTEKPKR
jgi:hypothetical protein